MSRPSSMPDPQVTVILPTYRRPASLGRVLAGLAVQEPGVDWELVVIDNEPAPGADAAFAAHAASFGGRARLVREARTGSAYARNRGIEEARGRVVAMIDDDVVPDPGWLRTLVEPVLAGGCAGAGGRVLLDPSVERPAWFEEESVGQFLARWDLGPEARDLEGDEIVLTANCAFDAARLRATGGFEPALGPQGGTPLVNDDALLVRRIREAGGVVRWQPDAVVYHELPLSRLNRRYLIRRAFAQGRSDWILDRDPLSERRFGGARVATSWLATELGRRRREGLRRPEVAFHALIDVVRTAGALREAARIALRRRG